MRYISQPVRKKDAMSLVTGQPVYVDDRAPKDCLVVKVLRSPHALCEDRLHPHGPGRNKYPAWRRC